MDNRMDPAYRQYRPPLLGQPAGRVVQNMISVTYGKYEMETRDTRASSS